MRDRHFSGFFRHFSPPDDFSGHPHHRRHGKHLHERMGRPGGRLFDYGELRLLILAMIAERPRHGYELIKAIEERFGGSYTPSPGVIYPTLSWLEDMGYATVDSDESNRKRFRITDDGTAFLAANRAAADELLARLVSSDERPGPVPATVVRAMENLKTALRLRLRRGAFDPAAADAIANALDEAAKTVERS